MHIHVYGDTKNEKIILLHAMFMDGKMLYDKFRKDFQDYCIISPDLSMHGSSENEFISAEEESAVLKNYLIENDMTDIKLLFGMSLGSRIALELIHDTELKFDLIYLDGTPVYKNARFARLFYELVFSSKLKKARKEKGLSEKKMGEIFGEENGRIMGRNFENMTNQSLSAIIDACSRFDFPVYSKSLQKRMYFDYGSKEYDKRCIKTLKKYYPNVHCIVRNGYDHCQYIPENKQGFFRELKKLMY